MKIVSVDFGDSHTGIAECDRLEMIATPVCIIDEKRFEVCADKVAEKIKELGAELENAEDNEQCRLGGMITQMKITMTKKGAKTYVDRDNGWTVITNDHSLAAHWEHTVAITDDGCDVLTLPADYP